MKIGIRMDDIVPGMDQEKFLRFYSLLTEYGVRPLLGIVPENRDGKLVRGNKQETETFFAQVRKWQEDGATLAMHGLYHLYTTEEGGLFPLNHKSEFAGLPYEKQKEMIAEGRRILQEYGIETDFFMAPSHSYDRSTLRALKENGFHRVTDGFGTKPYEREGLIFYPLAMRKVAALKKEGGGEVTFVVHANSLEEADFAFYERALRSGKIVSYSELLKTAPVRRGFLGNTGESLLARLKYTAVHYLR